MFSYICFHLVIYTLQFKFVHDQVSSFIEFLFRILSFIHFNMFFVIFVNLITSFRISFISYDVQPT